MPNFVTTTTTTPATTPPRVRHRSPNDSPLIVHKMSDYTEPDTAANVCWSEHWYGATLSTHTGLTERQHPLCVQWAVGVLLGAVEADGSGYAPRPWDQTHKRLTYTELLALEAPMVGGAVVDLDEIDDPVRGVVCLDCGHLFSPDYSPHLDRCAGCAERHDAEAGQ